MLNQANSSIHIRRIAKQYPQYFHLLLDGFDELSSKFMGNFEKILKEISSKEYSIILTVRDYQKDKLQSQVSSVTIQQKLNKFNDEEIKNCLQKSLNKKVSIDQNTLKQEISKLHNWLTEQVKLSEWLGIPFHVALISEWYIQNRRDFLNATRPSVSEIYNFIIQNRIERNTKRNRGDIYKLLNQIAWRQIFGIQQQIDLFHIKNYPFKKELSFDLERTGLLRNPYSENPELFHRTFAEFLVAKRLSRKIISLSCENDEVNFKLIKLLYQIEYRLVCHFFIGLFKTHHTDIDIPYEISKEYQKNFKQKWLLDIIGQKLTYHKDNNKLITWHALPSESDNQEESVDDSSPNRNIKTEKAFIQSLIDKMEFDQNKDIDISDLKDPFLKNSLNDSKLKDFFKIFGLYSQEKSQEKEKIFKLIWEKFRKMEECAFDDIFDNDILDWWNFDDLIELIAFGKKNSDTKKPEDFLSMRETLLNLFGKVEQLKNKKLFCSTETAVKHLRCLGLLENLKRMMQNNMSYSVYLYIKILLMKRYVKVFMI